MIVYLVSPVSRLQLESVNGMPVLLSYALMKDAEYIKQEYAATFRRILVDSGAFSEMNTGKKVDISMYSDWAEQWFGHADAVAGLDDINGDWKRSLDNYEKFPRGFPTFHDTDPPELLNELICMSRQRGSWLGIGLKPPRNGKEKWIRDVCEKIPDGIHVHGWVLRVYTHIRRLDSVDSTNWFRDAMKLRTISELKHLTYGECLEIVVKRYQRWKRRIVDPKEGNHGFFSKKSKSNHKEP